MTPSVSDMKRVLLIAILVLALFLGLAFGPKAQAQSAGKLGDANADSLVNIQDAIKILNYIFQGAGVSPLACLAAADLDGSLSINIQDVIRLLNLIFSGNTTWANLASCILTPATPGQLQWVNTIQGTSACNATGNGVATDSFGNVVFVGMFQGTID